MPELATAARAAAPAAADPLQNREMEARVNTRRGTVSSNLDRHRETLDRDPSDARAFEALEEHSSPPGIHACFHLAIL